MENTENQGPLWEVFIQSKAGQVFKHAGSVHAYDKEMAVENARDIYTRRNEGIALWVVPSSEIVAVSATESSSFFEPADDKVYRHPTFYNLPEGVKQM
ncbi:MAG: 1,2-phenylacetyl-CoA epoxidase subunit B [Crocinitomicaceae bacterium]|jgi:ring-1,2-phenylacetyl-CoA epoxidase subunit PaaB|nr:1,2-phenylacetyl-CoA epoxidase subunit B [Crocinitomicaceae bacterium]